MFENNIKFLSPFLDIEKPIPAKRNIPDWYKKLEHNLGHNTVKGCMPFLDSLTAGYIIKLPVDLKIRHNVINPETGFRDGEQVSALKDFQPNVSEVKLNINQKLEIHQPFQMAGSPLLEKNKNLPIHKFVNPWTIQTPKGYSCLFIAPLNNRDDRFEVLSGIVDTDIHRLPVNFPFIINTDKYPALNTVIKKGTPIVQVIPFKRDSWVMSIEKQKDKSYSSEIIKFFTSLIDRYKNNVWQKKKWN